MCKAINWRKWHNVKLKCLSEKEREATRIYGSAEECETPDKLIKNIGAFGFYNGFNFALALIEKELGFKKV